MSTPWARGLASLAPWPAHRYRFERATLVRQKRRKLEEKGCTAATGEATIESSKGKMRRGAFVPVASLFSRARPRPTREGRPTGLTISFVDQMRIFRSLRYA